jgi:Polyketide cyclase / dehydrase and lipid transport
VDETFGALGLTAKWGSVRAEALIQCSADAAWARIADVPNNASWFTSLVSSWCEPDPDTARPVRHVKLATGATMVEDLIVVDHVQRRLQYQLRPVMVITHHLATIDVIDLSMLPGAPPTGQCLVVYSTDLSPRSLALAFASGARRALVTLTEQLEQPVVPPSSFTPAEQ